VWWQILVGIAVGLLAFWLILLIALWRACPAHTHLSEVTRLLPDVIRLLRGLATDRSLSRGVRVRLWLLLGYLALPIDLVPDFIPGLGYADDAIIIALVLRSVIHRAGAEALVRHWPGTPAGLAAVRRLVHLPDPAGHIAGG
jgi:uncharacterized membrane protein YkvA (DUF1232 family)